MIWKNKEKTTLFYFYLGFKQDQTRNAVNMQNKSIFCPRYIIICGKGRTISLLFRDGKLSVPDVLKLGLWVFVVFNTIFLCVQFFQV